MQWLASVCVRRPVFATVLILAIVVVGIVGYSNLGVDRFPNVDLPIVRSSRRCRARRPQEVETEVTDKIEEAVNTISGIDELRSISTEGVSQVIVSFQLDKDIDVAAQEVREHVSHRAARAARGDDEPGRQQARSRRGAGPLRGAGVDAADPRDHRVRRQEVRRRSRASRASAR